MLSNLDTMSHIIVLYLRLPASVQFLDNNSLTFDYVYHSREICRPVIALCIHHKCVIIEFTVYQSSRFANINQSSVCDLA